MSNLIKLCVASVLLLFRTAGKVSSQQSVLYFFNQRPAYPRDCKEALDACHYQRSSGIFVVKPDGYHRPFEVYCDNKLDSGGWTVILRRHDGSVTFQRDWLDYKSGFGFLSQELWIGHEKLSFLTNQKIYELRIDVTYSDDTSIYALYSLFRISDDFSNYRLSSVGLYSGNLTLPLCPVNMEYGTCLCQSSCGDIQNCQPCPRNEACFCPNGFYLKGTDCVRREECGCYVDGVTIREGEVYIASGCSQRCFCFSNLLICDDNYRCSNNAVCERRNNVLQCYCNEGYVGDGITCEKNCSANTVYGTCTFQTLCAYPQISLPCEGEMCYCPTGFYLQEANCVRQQDCGCYIDGNILQEGQSYTAPGCRRRCSCANGQLLCNDSYRCDSNAACLQQNNMYQCTCNEGFIPFGGTCLSICSTNETYGTCDCEKSCGNPQVCTPCSTQGKQCYCPNGFYLQGQDCVELQDCNCFTDGTIIPEGGTYIAPGCSKRCSCFNGQRSCDDSYRCDPNAACLEQNNMYQCTCNEGFIPFGDICLSICSTNETYGLCNCEWSCGNPQVCTPCSTHGKQCYCPNGFYLQGQDCIRLQDCNCFTEGTIILEGETYIAPGCSKRCFCINGQLSCDDSYQCDPNAACLEQNNMYQCTCNEGFTPSGDTCLSICSTNETYGTCNCERTCGNPEVCTPCGTQGKQCYCPNGFYLQGQDCVPLEDCNCFTEETIIPEGAMYISAGCSKRCSCISSQLSCDVYQCSADAVCEERNNVLQCYCNAGFTGDGVNCIVDTPSDCQDIYDRVSTESGVYQIKPTTWQGDLFDVYCNMSDGGGWTVFQRRVDGSQDFFLYWSDYKEGFGTADHELWLGNDKLHSLTSQGDYSLRIDLLDSLGSPYYAKYSSFGISDLSDNYRLSLGTYSGNAGDSLSYYNGQAFSTRDRDNDGWSGNHCATRYALHFHCDGSYYFYSGAWWYNSCAYSSLNSPFGSGAFFWYNLPGGEPKNCNIKYSEMKVRRI